jgi:hypothetical protein
VSAARLTAASAAAAITLWDAPAPAAPAAGLPPATMGQPVQYGGPYNGNYPWYRRSCNFGYHYTCVYEYGGYRRCGCQADVIYSPNPYYGYGPAFLVPRAGYDPY